MDGASLTVSLAEKNIVIRSISRKAYHELYAQIKSMIFYQPAAVVYGRRIMATVGSRKDMIGKRLGSQLYGVYAVCF